MCQDSISPPGWLERENHLPLPLLPPAMMIPRPPLLLRRISEGSSKSGGGGDGDGDGDENGGTWCPVLIPILLRLVL